MKVKKINAENPSYYSRVELTGLANANAHDDGTVVSFDIPVFHVNTGIVDALKLSELRESQIGEILELVRKFQILNYIAERMVG